MEESLRQKVNSNKILGLTINVTDGQFSRLRIQIRDAIQDIEQSFGQPQKVTEGIKAKKNQFSCQFDHFECQFVLFIVTECPHIIHHILQVTFHKSYGGLEFLPDFFDLLVITVTVITKMVK